MGIWNRLLGRPGKNDFAQMMIKVLRGGGEQRPIRFDAEHFRLILGEDKDDFGFYLNNVYADYLRIPRRERSAFLKNFAAFTRPRLEEDLPRPEAERRLLPRVRERYYHESVRLLALQQGKADYEPFPTRLLNEHLTVEVVLDASDAVSILPTSQLEKWGINLDEAFAIARENLWKLSSKSFEQLIPGLWFSSAQDTHDASRLFLHDLVWQHEVKGKHVAMVPNRNVLLVSGSDDLPALERMVEVASEVLDQPRAMTGMAFVLDGSTWKPFLPPADSPIYQQFHELARQSSARDYAEQQTALKKIFEREGRDMYVAGAHWLKNEQHGRVRSLTSWSEGVEALLPRTDYLAMVRFINEKPKTVGYAMFEKVLAVAENLMTPTIDYPPRYHVRQWPTAEQLAAMDLVQKLP